MTAFECSRYALLVTRTDIFCTGLLLGGIVVIAARWAERFLDVRFSINQKKLDITLGNALLKIKTQLDDQVLKFEKK